MRNINDLRILWLYKIFGLVDDISTVLSKVLASFIILYTVILLTSAVQYHKYKNETVVNCMLGYSTVFEVVALITVVVLLILIKKKSERILSELYLDSDICVSSLFLEWKVYEPKLAWLSYILGDIGLLILAMLKPFDKINNIKQKLTNSLKDKNIEDCLSYKDLKIVWLYRLLTFGTMSLPILIGWIIGAVIVAILILATIDIEIPWLKLFPWIIAFIVTISILLFLLDVKVKRVLLNYTSDDLSLSSIFHNLENEYIEDSLVNKLAKVRIDPALEILSYIPNESPLAKIQKQKIREELQFS